jgi:hypothetical protein
MPTSEFVSTDSFAGRGEASTMRLAQCRSPLASSKPEFCLPMMTRRLPA